VLTGVNYNVGRRVVLDMAVVAGRVARGA